jgi:hypothetical protein
MQGKNGHYYAWQVIGSQQICYNASMLRDMIMKPLVCVFTFSFGGFVFHSITPRIKIYQLDPLMDTNIKTDNSNRSSSHTA